MKLLQRQRKPIYRVISKENKEKEMQKKPAFMTKIVQLLRRKANMDLAKTSYLTN